MTRKIADVCNYLKWDEGRWEHAFRDMKVTLEARADTVIKNIQIEISYEVAK